MMDNFAGTVTMALLFVLRCVVPLALTLLLSWAMDRVVARWEAEEAATAVTANPEPAPPESELVIPLRPNMTQLVKCWVFRECGHTDCSAFQNSEMLCWQLKIEETGQLPAACRQCAYYQKMLAVG